MRRTLSLLLVRLDAPPLGSRAVALADGVTNEPHNLRAAHPNCNLRLSAQRTNQMRRQRRRYGRVPGIH